MTIWVHLLSQSKPMGVDNVENAYVKDGMYCILSEGSVVKYPLCNIFRVIEEY